MSNLYLDPEIDKEVVTHSSLKVFRRCPQQYRYKYIERLKPRMLAQPLKRGTWLHSLLEEHHAGRDWKAMHRELCIKYEELLDDEKDYYGDLPNECYALMRAYVYYYKNDPWKTIETEFTIEVELPNGTVYRGKIDILFENQFGLYAGDHKTHKTLPDMTFRLLDAQSAMYLWALLKKKYDIQGFVWNYIRVHAPSKPKMIKDGSRLSKVLGETDFHTYGGEIKRLIKAGELKMDGEIYAKIMQLRNQVYVPGEPQTSPFFRRDVLEKGSPMLNRVMKENYHTIQRIKDYPFDRPDIVERVVDRSCTFTCGYRDLCTVELMGGNPKYIRNNQFRVGDPLDYYQDRVGEQKGAEA